MGKANDPRMAAARTYAAADHDWHIDAAMSEIAIQYALDPAMYIAPQILPVVNVGKESDKFYIWDREDWFRIPTSTLRARRTAPKVVEPSVSSAGYHVKNYMLEGQIPFEDLANADAALDLENSTTRYVTQLLMLDQENRIASLLTTAGNTGSGNALSGTNRWDDYANSSPISDVNTGKNWVHLETGQPVTTMVVGHQVHNALIQHPDMIDRIKYVQAATQATVEKAIADIFGVKTYLIGSAVKNTGEELQAASMGFVWGKNVILLHVPPAPARNIPSAGYSFRWKPEGFTDFVVETKDDEDIKARRKRVGYFQDEIITGKQLFYLLTTVVN